MGEVPALERVQTRKRPHSSWNILGDNIEADKGTHSPQFWKKVKLARQGSLPGDDPVAGLSFSPVAPLDDQQWAVAGRFRLDFYSLTDKQVQSSYTKFKDVLRCIAHRCDGKLIATSDDTGLVQVLDINTRTALRRYRGHKGPVHCCAFSRDKIHLMSGGDDASLKLWNMATPKFPILDITAAHGDYIRCLAASPADNKHHMWATGGHDGTVKVWDLSSVCSDYNSKAADEETLFKYDNDAQKSSLCVASLDHGSPVTAITFFNDSSNRLATAGGHFVKIWGIEAESPPRLIKTVQCHLKTVTGVGVTSDNNLLVTSSMDRTVKFHGLDDYAVRHSVDHELPVVSLALSTRGLGFLAGLSNGRWVLRRKRSGSTAPAALEAGGAQKRVKAPLSPSDIQVKDESSRKKRSVIDRLLLTFQYQSALDVAVSDVSKVGVDVAHGLVEELVQRGALDVACRGRDEESILPILAFVHSNLGFGDSGTKRLVELTNVLIQENEWLMKSSSDKVRNLLHKISSKLSFELCCIGAFRELLGMMDARRSEILVLGNK